MNKLLKVAGSTSRPSDALTYNQWVLAMFAKRVVISSRCITCGSNPFYCGCNKTEKDESKIRQYNTAG